MKEVKLGVGALVHELLAESVPPPLLLPSSLNIPVIPSYSSLVPNIIRTLYSHRIAQCSNIDYLLYIGATLVLSVELDYPV